MPNGAPHMSLELLLKSKQAHLAELTAQHGHTQNVIAALKAEITLVQGSSKRKPGRPPKNGRVDSTTKASPAVVGATKMSGRVCGKCKQTGHNARTCGRAEPQKTA